ncbi:hypothetical protein ACFSCX_18180 [Bacillus salitolerans]|uniref:Uncharacterized protein n=1 Tax=Bacillus salitolerans TaxID=1437434 RepID=A0ABW4LTI9_9BACI
MNPFHACATCIHYRVEKSENSSIFTCSRLGYETKPNFKFNCWTPKDNVYKLMVKRGIIKEGESI